MKSDLRRARKGVSLHHHPKGSGIPRPEAKAPDPRGNMGNIGNIKGNQGNIGNITHSPTEHVSKTISWG